METVEVSLPQGPVNVLAQKVLAAAADHETAASLIALSGLHPKYSKISGH